MTEAQHKNMKKTTERKTMIEDVRDGNIFPEGLVIYSTNCVYVCVVVACVCVCGERQTVLNTVCGGNYFSLSRLQSKFCEISKL